MPDTKQKLSGQHCWRDDEFFFWLRPQLEIWLLKILLPCLICFFSGHHRRANTNSCADPFKKPQRKCLPYLYCHFSKPSEGPAEQSSGVWKIHGSHKKVESRTKRDGILDQPLQPAIDKACLERRSKQWDYEGDDTEKQGHQEDDLEEQGHQEDDLEK